MILDDLQNDVTIARADPPKKRYRPKIRRKKRPHAVCLRSWTDPIIPAYHHIYTIAKPIYYRKLTGSSETSDYIASYPTSHVLVSIRCPFDMEDGRLVLSGRWEMTIQPCRESGRPIGCIPLISFGPGYPLPVETLEDADPGIMLRMIGCVAYGDRTD